MADTKKNFKEKLEAVRKSIAVLLTFADVPAGDPAADPQPGEYKLADGTIVKCEALEAGKAVTLVTAEGESAAPEGNYTLEDGRILVVGADGNITEVQDAPAAAEPVAMSEEVTAAFSAMEQRLEMKFTALLTAKDEEISAIKKANAALIKQNKDTVLAFSALQDIVKELGETTPAPITEQKSTDRPLKSWEKAAEMHGQKL